jgi:transcriptional regulator with XRE-family HTH domain
MSYRAGDIVKTPEDIGRAVRLARKRQKLRQDDLAAMAGFSHVFLGDLEKGKGTVSVGRMLKVLSELGLRLRIEAFDEPQAP